MNHQHSSLSQSQPEANISEVYSDDSELDLADLWNTITHYKWSIVIITLLCFSAATSLAFLMTPKYQADVLVAPADESKGGGSLAALAGQFGGLAEMAGVNLGGSGGNKDAAIAYLKSRVFIENYIKEKDLLPILFYKKWDPEAKKWNVKKQDEIPTYWDAYQFFTKKIVSVTPDKKTGLITLSIEWKDREQAVEWANDLIKRANAHLRQKAISETEISLSYLEKELQKTSIVEVQQAIFKIMESQVKTRMMANVQEQFAFKVIDPAALMDEDDFVKPKRPLMMAMGLVAGLILGIFTAFVRMAIQRKHD